MRGTAASAKPQIRHSIFKIQNYLNGGRLFGLGTMFGQQPAEGACSDTNCGSQLRPFGRKFRIQNYIRVAACGVHVSDAKELRASAGRRLRPAAIPYRNRKFMIQNSIFKIIFGQQPAEGACSGTNCVPPLPGGCGPHGPDGPAQPQEKPAAERTGLRRKGAALRPGRLRAAATSYEVAN